MLSPNEVHIQATRRRDMERAAQENALRALIRDTQQKQSPHAVALAKVGDILVNVGSKLQDRYGTLIEEASQTPAEAC
jgi:hypothetical protein